MCIRDSFWAGPSANVITKFHCNLSNTKPFNQLIKKIRQPSYLEENFTTNKFGSYNVSYKYLHFRGKWKIIVISRKLPLQIHYKQLWFKSHHFSCEQNIYHVIRIVLYIHREFILCAVFCYCQVLGRHTNVFSSFKLLWRGKNKLTIMIFCH